MLGFKEENNKYIIDFGDVQNYNDIQTAIAKAFDFPEWYGCNWDALWDMLTDMAGDLIHIEISSYDVLNRLYKSEAETLMSILKEFKHYSNNKYLSKIKIEITSENERIEIM